MTRLRFVPAPSADAALTGCISRNLRLIEHYELDYHLSREEPTPEDRSEIAARRWTSYHCAGCQNDFTNRALAFAHLADTTDLPQTAAP